jgi:PAS domain S-box-containing protein
MVNKSYQKLLNLTKTNILGKTDFEIFSKEQASINYISEEKFKKNDSLETLEVDIIFPNGQLHCFNTNKFKLLNADKEIIGYCSIMNDITKQKITQAKLQQSESWFKAIVQNSLDYVTVVSPQGEKKYITPSVKRVLGFSSKEYLGINFFENIDPTSQIELIAAVNEIAKSDTKKNITLQIKVKNKKDDWVWVEMILNNQIKNKNINGILVHVRNITESKETKVRLKQITNKHKLMVDNSPDIITIKDLNGRYVDINKTFHKTNFKVEILQIYSKYVIFINF